MSIDAPSSPCLPVFKRQARPSIHLKMLISALLFHKPHLSTRPISYLVSPKLKLLENALFRARYFTAGRLLCKLPRSSHAFSDPLPLSIGIDQTARHAPSLWGSADQRWLNWDGSCDSLWCQAIGPIEKTTNGRLTNPPHHSDCWR